MVGETTNTGKTTANRTTFSTPSPSSLLQFHTYGASCRYPHEKKKHTRLRKVIETAETHGFLIFSSVSEETLRRERPSSRLQRLEISVNDHRSLCKNSLHPQQRTPMEDHSLDHFNNRSNNQHILGYYYGLGPLPTQLEEQMVERQATYPTQIRLLHSHCKNTLP